jgi:basic membrane protein A
VAGEKQPRSNRFIAAYQAGRSGRSGDRTLNAYSQDFTDQAKCKAIALNQIAAGPSRPSLRARTWRA